MCISLVSMLLCFVECLELLTYFGICVKLTTHVCFVEMQSAVKQNLHLETEADINKLANIMLNASYTYLSLVRLATFLSFLKRTE